MDFTINKVEETYQSFGLPIQLLFYVTRKKADILAWLSIEFVDEFPFANHNLFKQIEAAF